MVESKNLKTVVLGASTNPSRYSYTATVRLQEEGHEVVPVGIKSGKIENINIQTDNPRVEDVHTITLYIGPDRQPPLYDYILSLEPQRLIFNPGTENIELKKLAEAQGIETIYACTLVMLSIGNYSG